MTKINELWPTGLDTSAVPGASATARNPLPVPARPLWISVMGIAGMSHADMFRTMEELIGMACEFQEKRTAYVKKESK